MKLDSRQTYSIIGMFLIFATFLTVLGFVLTNGEPEQAGRNIDELLAKTGQLQFIQESNDSANENDC